MKFGIGQGVENSHWINEAYLILVHINQVSPSVHEAQIELFQNKSYNLHHFSLQHIFNKYSEI